MELSIPPFPVPVTLIDDRYTQEDPSRGIKQASPDIVIFDESEIDPGYITQSFFDEFGGTELIKISRSDIINGNQVSYNPIINLGTIRQRFNSKNIINIGPLQENVTRYGINLFGRGVEEPHFDESGNLVVEIDVIRQDESIEVQVASAGTISRVEE